jgi:hypothetical protein
MSVGTRLSILFLNPKMCAPQNNPFYGAQVKSFVSSNIFKFGEKSWQLRSIWMPEKGWILIPFILNSGGSPWNEPILSDPVLKHLGLDRSIDMDKQIPFIPQPLGKIRFPLQFQWNEKRNLSIPQNDLRFNLLGGSLAECISTIHTNLDDIPDQDIIRNIMHKYSAFGASRESVEAEIHSIRKASLNQNNNQWTSECIPISGDCLLST